MEVTTESLDWSSWNSITCYPRLLYGYLLFLNLWAGMYEVEEGWLVNPGADDESYRSPGVEVAWPLTLTTQGQRHPKTPS